jgi:AcrR family transcriptional regulator
VQPTDAAEESRPSKVGRPPLIDRSLIAQAASEVGLSNLTMQAVADRLGVSVPSLYYHVGDRAELARLAAEYTASSIGLPEDRDQHWSIWLTEWAEYARAAFASDPAILQQFMLGTLGSDRVLSNVDTIVSLLLRNGFTAEDAMNAYVLVSACAIGAAVTEWAAKNTAQATALKGFERGRYPHLAKLGGNYAIPSFSQQIYAVIVGIAVTRNEDPNSVRRVLSREKKRVASRRKTIR